MLKDFRNVPVATSQRQTFFPQSMVNSVFPSEVKAGLRTPSLCPLSEITCLPAAVSQRSTEPSGDPLVTRSLSSGENAEGRVFVDMLCRIWPVFGSRRL